MTLRQRYRPQADALAAVCRRLHDLGFVVSEGGNCAWRLEENLVLITPTQLCKGSVTPEDLVFVNLDGTVQEGERRPTGELPMYLKFFSKRNDVASVIHCHPPYACAASILKGRNILDRPFFPETVIEVGPVAPVPYAEPLTQELAQNFEPFLAHYNSFIMRNHGLVTMSRRDISWTMLNVELLEASARSVLIALQCGEVQELDRQAVAGLQRVMTARNLPLHGTPGANTSLVDCYFPGLSTAESPASTRTGLEDEEAPR